MLSKQNKIYQAAELMAVARGEASPDLLLRGGQLVNVYSGEIHPADVAIYNGRIAAIGTALSFPGNFREIDCQDYFIAPGYIEPHAHPWVTYNPVTLSKAALLGGTTTIVMDNLMFMLQAGKESFLQIVESLRSAPVNIFWAARPVPQSSMEGEEQLFGLETLVQLLEDESIVASAELTRWPSLVAGDEGLLDKLQAVHDRFKRCDGHTAGCKPLPLNAVVAGGIDACHESINAEEARERLRRGLWLMLRHSSLRPDLPELLPKLLEQRVSLERVMLTTDGPSPLFIAEQGLIDGLLRQAVGFGLDPVQAIQLVTLHPAMFYGLDRELGGIAPGRRADILLLPDLEKFIPDVVFSAGQEVVNRGELITEFPVVPWEKLGFHLSWGEGDWLERPEIYRAEFGGKVLPVIELISCVITRRLDIKIELSGQGTLPEDLLYCSLVHLGGKWISNGFLQGFASGIEGLASTFNTALELLVVGSDHAAMAKAAAEVRRMGGGIAIVEGGHIVFRLALPLGGVANEEDLAVNARQVGELLSLLQKYGYQYHDPLYTILFLPCDFLPGIRLSRYGVLDVKSKEVLLPAKQLT